MHEKVTRVFRTGGAHLPVEVKRGKCFRCDEKITIYDSYMRFASIKSFDGGNVRLKWQIYCSECASKIIKMCSSISKGK